MLIYTATDGVRMCLNVTHQSDARLTCLHTVSSKMRTGMYVSVSLQDPPCLIFLNIQAGRLIVRIALIVEILDFHNQRESTEAERNVEQ